MVHEKVTKRHLERRAHLAQMPYPQNHPVQLVASASSTGRPTQTMEACELKTLKIPEDAWYKVATASRAGWRATYRQVHAEIASSGQHREQPMHQVKCPQCQRIFCRESDIKRHKCLIERRKLVSNSCAMSKKGFSVAEAIQSTHVDQIAQNTTPWALGFVPPMRGCMTEIASETTGQDRCVCRFVPTFSCKLWQL
jgi:hypothetical protein